MTSKSDQITALTELNEALENYFSNTTIPQLFVDANLILRKYTPPAMKQFKLKEELIYVLNRLFPKLTFGLINPKKSAAVLKS